MGKYSLKILTSFEAAHQLTSYNGAPEPVHGHSWKVEAELESATLDSEGMAFDFVAIKSTLDELASRFHHQNINEVPPFDEKSPTTEHLARWFLEELRQRLPSAPLTAVTVWEGPLCSARYQD